VLPGQVERAVFEVRGQDLVAGPEPEWPRSDVDAGARVGDEDEVVRIRADISAECGSCLP